MIFLIRAAGALMGFAVASIYGIGITLIRRDRSRVPYDYARMISRLMAPWLGLRVDVEGEENLRRQRPCVYIVNHQSFVDAPILGRLFPERTVLVGKKELRYFPLFGWIYTTTGNILIDRSHSASALQRMREAERAIRDRGVSVWMFPEGTRGSRSGELLPFKKGAFYLAIAAQVPLVPIVVSPLAPLFDLPRFRIRPGTVRVSILDPIQTTSLREGDVPALIAEAHRTMSEALKGLPTTPARLRKEGRQ